jgi:hypothetical protein
MALLIGLGALLVVLILLLGVLLGGGASTGPFKGTKRPTPDPGLLVLYTPTSRAGQQRPPTPTAPAHPLATATPYPPTVTVGPGTPTPTPYPPTATPAPTATATPPPAATATQPLPTDTPAPTNVPTPTPPSVITVDDSVIGSGVNQFTYNGNWMNFAGALAAPDYNSTISFSNETGDTAVISFTGSEIKLFGTDQYSNGIVGITLDSGTEQDIDTYAPDTILYQQQIYDSGPLSDGSHTLTIRVTGNANADSSNTYVTVDDVQITS